MIRRLLYGEVGKTRRELSRFHWRMRYIKTWMRVVLWHGESWREYRERWIERA